MMTEQIMAEIDRLCLLLVEQQYDEVVTYDDLIEDQEAAIAKLLEETS